MNSVCSFEKDKKVNIADITMTMAGKIRYKVGLFLIFINFLKYFLRQFVHLIIKAL